MKTIQNWTIIELTDVVLTGVVDGQNIYSDKLLGIKGYYAVTQNNVYILGSPDPVWATTEGYARNVGQFYLYENEE